MSTQRKKNHRRHTERLTYGGFINDFTNTFAENISKITITKDAPYGMLAEWNKKYDIVCQVEVK
jgi:hypothetical protein